jgi:hypothetical protein
VGEGSLLTGNPAMFFFNGAVVENVSRIPGVARASPQILVAPWQVPHVVLIFSRLLP